MKILHCGVCGSEDVRQVEPMTYNAANPPSVNRKIKMVCDRCGSYIFPTIRAMIKIGAWEMDDKERAIYEARGVDMTPYPD
jgi:hypothetical protein